MAAPDTPIDRLTIISESEHELVLHDFNTAALPCPPLCHPDQTIHGLLEHWAKASPMATAVIFEVGYLRGRHLCTCICFAFPPVKLPSCVADCQGESLSYAELDKRANQLGAHAYQLGRGPGMCRSA